MITMRVFWTSVKRKLMIEPDRTLLFVSSETVSSLVKRRSCSAICVLNRIFRAVRNVMLVKKVYTRRATTTTSTQTAD